MIRVQMEMEEENHTKMLDSLRMYFRHILMHLPYMKIG